MKEQLIEYGIILTERKFVWGYSGNISVRSGPNVFIISAGGTNLGSLKIDDLISCHINRDLTEGKRRPSMETGLHRGIYRTCPDAGAVIHSQPFYSTLIACSDLDVRTDVIPEAMAYIGRVERVPYFHAGSRILADAVAEKAVESSVLLLENHGVVCFGDSIEDALIKTEALEFLCRLFAVSSNSNIDLKYLGNDVMDDFISHLENI